MRGHIVKGSKDSYSIKVSLGFDATAKRYKYQWFTVKGTKRDAEKHLGEILHQLDNGTFVTSGKTKLADYLERWLKEYAWANLAPRTAESNEHISRRYVVPFLGNYSLVNLKPEHLQRFYRIGQWSKPSDSKAPSHHDTQSPPGCC